MRPVPRTELIYFLPGDCRPLTRFHSVLAVGSQPVRARIFTVVFISFESTDPPLELQPGELNLQESNVK